MKEVVINEKNYLLPQNWDEVTFEQFTRIVKLQKDLSGNEHDMIVVAKLSAAILNIHVTDLYLLPLSNFTMLSEILEFVFATEPKANNVKDSYCIGSTLVYVDKDLRKYTAGTMLSYLISTQNMDDENDKARYATAIMLREDKSLEFNAEKYAHHANMVYGMNIQDMMGLSAFFLNTQTNFMEKNTKNYSEATKQAQEELEQTPLKDGGGTDHSKNSQWAILLNTPQSTEKIG